VSEGAEGCPFTSEGAEGCSFVSEGAEGLDMEPMLYQRKGLAIIGAAPTPNRIAVLALHMVKYVSYSHDFLKIDMI
jgi:hypothetical protein